MRLVTGMGPAVDGQGAALDERLAARFVVASVGAFIGMYSVMALEIGFSVETLWEKIAISIWWCVGTLTSTAEVGILAQDCLPLGNLHAIRTERGAQSCQRQRLHL